MSSFTLPSFFIPIKYIFSLFCILLSFISYFYREKQKHLSLFRLLVSIFHYLPSGHPSTLRRPTFPFVVKSTIKSLFSKFLPFTFSSSSIAVQYGFISVTSFHFTLLTFLPTSPLPHRQRHFPPFSLFPPPSFRNSARIPSKFPVFASSRCSIISSFPARRTSFSPLNFQAGFVSPFPFHYSPAHIRSFSVSVLKTHLHPPCFFYCIKSGVSFETHRSLPIISARITTPASGLWPVGPGRTWPSCRT